MKRAAGYILTIIAAALSTVSCNVTRRLSDGEYLVQKVRIEEDKRIPRKERIKASTFEKYIRQTPNRHFLGTNFYVWIYNEANPDKDNWWNNLKRKMGEEPVLLDMSLTDKSVENLKIYMDSRGYFSSRVSYEVDTLRRRRRAYVTYRPVQGQPYRISSITYDFRDRFLRQIILPDTVHTLLHRGEIFDISVLDAERERITTFLKERGYYNFTVSNIEYVADTLANNYDVALRVVVKQNVTGYDERGNAVTDNNMVYRIKRIDIYPDYRPLERGFGFGEQDFAVPDTVGFRGLNVVTHGRANVRPRVLRQQVAMYPNFIYNSAQVERTYSDLMSLGYFRSARIVFDELPRSDPRPNFITYVGSGSATDSTRTQYTREGYLSCSIFCTPALKQSFNIELEASTTASFYGLSATAGYQNSNIFRGAELFDASVTAGYEYVKGAETNRNAIELGVRAGISFPRALPFRVSPLGSIIRPSTKLELSFNYQDRPYYRRDLWRLTWAYSWYDRSYSSFVVRPLDINWIHVGYLNESFKNSLQNQYLIRSYESQFIFGLSGGYTYNSQRRNIGRNATLLRVNAEVAGNLLDGIEHLFSHPAPGKDYYEILGIRYAQYFRVDIDLSHKIMLGKVTAVAGRIFAGCGLAYGNSSSIPFDRMFYAGGSNSMRGWAARTLGPGSSPKPERTVYPSQLGDMKLEANIEFRFPIWGIFHGAAFFDVGNIWYVRGRNAPDPESVFRFDNFYKQLGFNTGVGLRLDIKFAILRLDWGIQLHNPNNPAGERWIHNFKLKNTALNFGVGYPF